MPVDSLTKEELGEDIALILYIIPFAINGGYSLILWTTRGFSISLPADIYLAVTKNSIVFLAGLASILLASVIELITKSGSERARSLQLSARRLEILATASVILSLVFAWSATGYSANLRAAVDMWLEGRYPLIFPSLLLVTSFVMNPLMTLSQERKKFLSQALAIGLVIGAPLVFYAL